MEAPWHRLQLVVEALLEVGLQMLLFVAAWLDWFFTEHLLLSNIVSAALLLGLADFSIQTLEIYLMAIRHRYDTTRNYRSMQVGLVLGVFNHLWYAFLEAQVSGQGLVAVFQKIALDQAIAGPFFSSAFLVGMGLLEGHSTQEVYREWRQKFIHIYMVDWMFWPLAQFINFYLVPYRFRVFYVNFATFLWNTFLCYAKHHSGERQVRRHHHRSQLALTLHQAPTTDTSDAARATGSNSRSHSPLKLRSVHKKRIHRLMTRHSSPRSIGSRLRQRRKSIPMQLDIPSTGPQTWSLGSAAGGITSYLSLSKRPSLLGSTVASSATDIRAQNQQLDCGELSPTPEASMHSYRHCSCSSSASSINNTCAVPKQPDSTSTLTSTTTSTLGKRRLLLPKGSSNTNGAQRVKTPAVRKLGMFADRDARGPQAPAAIARKVKTQPIRPPALGMRSNTFTPHQKTQPLPQSRAVVATATAAVAAGDVARGVWSARPVSNRTTMLPIQHRTLTTAQAIEELRANVSELRSLVTTGQRKMSKCVNDTQAQVTRLQELSTLILLAVKDGHTDLSGKADQLTEWMTAADRAIDMDQVRSLLEDVLKMR